MASVGEVNAAFDVIKPKLRKMVQDKVPWMFQAQVAGLLETPETTRELAAIIKQGLEAAEHQRKAEQPN